MLGVAKVRNPLQFVGTQVREHRIHLQNDRKFGLFTHSKSFKSSDMTIGAVTQEELCHTSHNSAPPLIIFRGRFERHPVSGISSGGPARMGIAAGPDMYRCPGTST